MKELTDYIWYKEDILDKKLCDRLVKKWDKDAKNQVESGSDNADQDINRHLRKGKEINVSKVAKDDTPSKPIWKKDHKLLVDRTAEVLKQYGEELNLDARHIPEKYGFEEFRIKRYDNNDVDTYEVHSDVINYNSARRFLGIIYYLNDVEEGGNTSFPKLEVDFKPKKGTALVFPAIWIYLYEEQIVISNPKFVLGTYLHYL